MEVRIREVSDNLHWHSTVINKRQHFGPRTFFGQYNNDRPVIVVLPEEGPRTETLPLIDDS